MRQSYERRLDEYVAALSSLGDSPLARQGKVLSTVRMCQALSDAFDTPDREPLGPLTAALERQLVLIGEYQRMRREEAPAKPAAGRGDRGDRTRDLYEQAWTVFSDDTYDHSVGLMRERLLANGFGPEFFKGKRCFDGGCGTGRLSVAMAEMGAAEVVAADIGGRSLDYLRRVIARYGLSTITVAEHDITTLTPWPDQSFDFVASNGVLHHTGFPERGLLEHFRITRGGGVFWLYLYSAGGLYWAFFDRLRDVIGVMEAGEIKEILRGLNIREGMIYFYLDNFLAPRRYSLTSEVVGLLSQHGAISWSHARGRDASDDPCLGLAQPFGPLLMGPEGEVRILVRRLG